MLKEELKQVEAIVDRAIEQFAAVLRKEIKDHIQTLERSMVVLREDQIQEVVKRLMDAPKGAKKTDK